MKIKRTIPILHGREMLLEIQHCVRVQGYLKLTAVKLDGTVRPLTGWFPNLITNNGLNNIGAANQFIGAVHVGEGSATPQFTDTTLDQFLASTSAVFSSASGASLSAPYYGWNRQTYRFGAGAAQGNLTEVAMAVNTSSGNLFNRALILDLFGVPTVVTVLSDEYLDVSFELRCYAPDVPEYANIMISGSPYDVEVLPSEVTNGTYWAPPFSWATARSVFGVGHIVYSGALGAVTGSPSGITSSDFSLTRQSYSNNSYYIDLLYSAVLDAANVAGGIQSTTLNTTLGRFQYGWNPKIMKDNTKTMSLLYRLYWARYSPGSP